LYLNLQKNNDGSWNESSVTHYASRILTKIGAPGATTHTLRHTFASQLLNAGAPVWTVSRLLGHSSITVTENTYAHLIPDHTKQVMSLLPY